MPSDTAEATGPVPEQFIGESTARTAKRLFHATRPKFFPASLLPVLAGSAWGFMVAGQFDVFAFLLALFATMCVHGAANVLNDVGDESGGTDRLNEARVYPYTGGSRFIQDGIMSSGNMARWGCWLVAMAMAAGLVLLYLKGVMILWFGLTGIGLTVLYSLGPARLSSLGLGELAVGIGLGVLPVVGAAWLQTGVIDTNVILFSLPVSAWVTAILLINEVPDIEADGATGKRTLPVRLGLNGTATLYLLVHGSAAAAAIWLTIRGGLPIAAPVVPVMLMLLAYKASTAIRRGVVQRKALTGAIESTLGIHTIGSIWMTGCALAAAFWSMGTQ